MSCTKTSSSLTATVTLPSPPPPPPVNLWLVLSESKRIINAHLLHFLALSVLFLLPISLSPSPSIFRLLANQPPRTGDETKTVVLVRVSYTKTVVVNVFKTLAIGSIVYSVFQGFHGRPVKLISSVKSSFTSFFRLLATLVSTSLILFGVYLILGFAAILLMTLIEIIFPRLEIDFLPPFIIVMIISSVIVIKLDVDWILACVIVVVESKVWGLTPLKRSKSLMKGMRSVSFSIILFFVATQLTLGWISSRVAASARIYDNDVFFVIWIVISSLFRTLLTLYNLAAISVMYIYCKAWEIAQESAREYVSLPFDDDGKVYNNV